MGRQMDIPISKADCYRSREDGMSNQQIFTGRLGIDEHGDSRRLETPSGAVLIDVTDFPLDLDDGTLHQEHVVSIIGRMGIQRRRPRPNSWRNGWSTAKTFGSARSKCRREATAVRRSITGCQSKGNCSASEASHASDGATRVSTRNTP